MKKTVGILAVVGILLLLLPFSAMGENISTFDGDSAANMKTGYEVQEKKQYQLYENNICDRAEPLLIQGGYLLRNRFQQNNGAATTDTPGKKSTKIRGIWGFTGDNESDGYFAGQLIKKPRVVVFRGVYNLTGNDSYGKVIGIMKRGYFNGRLVTPDGEKYRIVGLYKIDRENGILKLRWMTAHRTGWAIGRIITS